MSQLPVILNHKKSAHEYEYKEAAELSSLLLINNATVFIETAIANDNYVFQQNSEGTYLDWANGWNKSKEDSTTVHTLNWEIDGSFQLNSETVGLEDSSEEIGKPFNLGDDLIVLSYYKPKIISKITPNASYWSYYFSLKCLYDAGALDEKIFDYFNNEVFFPDYAKGFFFPDDTLFCEWEKGTDEYFQHHVCEQIFNELVARGYLRFYRPKIDPQSIEINYSPGCIQPNSTTETLRKDFMEFINAGYYLAVFKIFADVVGKEIIETLSTETKQWLAKTEI